VAKSAINTCLAFLLTVTVCLYLVSGVTTHLENMEKPGNYKVVREKTGNVKI